MLETILRNIHLLDDLVAAFALVAFAVVVAVAVGVIWLARIWQ